MFNVFQICCCLSHIFVPLSNKIYTPFIFTNLSLGIVSKLSRSGFLSLIKSLSASIRPVHSGECPDLPRRIIFHITVVDFKDRCMNKCICLQLPGKPITSGRKRDIHFQRFCFELLELLALTLGEILSN